MNNSKKALKEVKESGLVLNYYQKIKAAILAIGTGNKTEIAEYLGVFEERVHKRFSEMERDGSIERCGDRLSKATGKSQQVWKLSNGA